MESKPRTGTAGATSTPRPPSPCAASSLTRRDANRRTSAAADAAYTPPDADLLDIDEALTRLATEDSQAAQLIQLRYFGGLSFEDAAGVVGLSRSSAYEHWAYARVRLRCLLEGE